MSMDLSSIISQLTQASQSDSSFVDKLEANPVALIESITGIDLPDEMLTPVLSGLQSNLGSTTAPTAQATETAASQPNNIAGIANSYLASEGLDVDGDGDVDFDDLKAGIIGSLM